MEESLLTAPLSLGVYSVVNEGGCCCETAIRENIGFSWDVHEANVQCTDLFAAWKMSRLLNEHQLGDSCINIIEMRHMSLALK